MILGSVTFEQSICTGYLERIRSFINLDTFFSQVVSQFFSGGYYLNPAFPVTISDIFFSDNEKDILVIMSGFFYNKQELEFIYNDGKKLPASQLIAIMFHAEGPEFIKKLNGDFSIFVHKPGNKECYLFRDHVGIRPLVWTTYDKILFFSSEIIGFSKAFSTHDNEDTEYLLASFKYINNRRTPNKDVLKLKPGHYLRYSKNGIEISCYWNPEKIKTDRNLKYDQMSEDLRILLDDSIKIRCDNRFFAGAHVTGGIDSGIVSSFARREYSAQEKFYGFSWSPVSYSPKNVHYDERDLVIKLCIQNNIEPVFSSLSQEDFFNVVSAFGRNHGYYSEDSISEQVVRTGTNLVFSGWGGDEFISTGDRAIEQDLLRNLNFKLYFKRNPIKHHKKLIKYLFESVLLPAIGLLDYETAKSFRDEARYIKKAYKKSDREAIAYFYFHTSRHQLHLNMLKSYHLQERCEYWSLMGFRKGIEYRYPLLDKRIIEYMLKVPSELLCTTDYFRPLLRELVKDILPEEVRVNWDKSDPVYREWIETLFTNASMVYMNEIETWKTKTYMGFVDFDMLLKDIGNSNLHLEGIKNKPFCRPIVYLKAIDSFCRDYFDNDYN